MCSLPTVLNRRCASSQEQTSTARIPRQNHREEETEYWGDKMRTKHNKMIRICFGNVNNIGQHRESYKSLQLKEVIDRKDIDLMCMAEMGVNWSKIAQRDNIWERTRNWFEDIRIAASFHTKDPMARRCQYGGTAMIAVNSLVAKINQTGYDPSGLGRWSWILMRGKRDTITRIITAYCPVKPSISGTTGQHTVYAQHLRVSSRDPIEAFWQDLGTAIDEWSHNEEQLIICGDWNTSVVGADITAFMGSRGLSEVITARHGTNPPATYNRGSKSIDGIFTSAPFLGVRGGYLEYGTTPGDHRGLWIDVPQETLMGFRMSDIPTSSIRRLQVTDPNSRKAYQEKSHALFIRHNIYGRILEIRNNASNPMTHQWGLKFNALDKEMEKYMKLAASKCRKIKVGGKTWSLKLQKARRTINLWKLVIQRLKGCNVHARTIIRARKRVNIKKSLVSLEEAETLLHKAFKHYKIIRQKDEQHSLAFREELAQARAKEGNHSAASELRQMNLREQQRKNSRRIKATLKRNTRCGTTRIQVTSNGRQKDITKRSEMEQYIIRENEMKYHQTEQRCPLLQGELLEDIGLLGDGPAVEDILKGTYTFPTGTTEITKKWIKNLYIKNRDTREAVTTTLKEYKRGWKQAKEHTASGDLHFGHYKASAMHDMLSWAHFIMAGIPRATSFVPERWKRGTDVMLLKKEGYFLLEKLRTIVLFESDFNQENKRLGREAMNLALDKNMISEEQYSRPGRSAQDNATNKRLMFDYQRIKRQGFGMCACDLKSCYDRIVHNAASLALQRVGVRKSDIASMFGTIQTMVHKVRTAFGDSAVTYQADNPEFLLPVQGTCQGNGAGPSIWSILCSTIFEVLHKEGFSSTFQYALSRGIYKLCGFAYVDDCDLFFLGHDTDEIFEGLASMLKMWDELMEVTGAAIAPDKCWWYLVEFTWKKGRWKYSDTGNQFDLKVRNKDGVEESLQYLPSKVAKEMLGVFLAPNGDSTAQIAHMKKKSNTWASHIKSGNLATDVAWTALTTTILKSLEYPLAATSLSKQQIKSIVYPALGAGLQASGICRNFPRAVLYGPLRYQGLNLQNLYHTQSIRHIKDIVDQTWRDTPSAKLLLANIEGIKLDAGIGGSIFKRGVPLTWLTSNNLWVTETLKFCQTYDITFAEPGASLKTKRENDSFLMEGFIAARASLTELKALNRCRIYMQVTTVSDISNGEGTKLHKNVFNRKKLGRRDTHVWPIQGYPPAADWRIWEHYIREELGKFNSYPTPLGPWTLENKEFMYGWDYFITPDNEIILHSNGQWNYFTRRTSDRGRAVTARRSDIRRVSTTAPRRRIFRVTVDIRGEIISTSGYSIQRIPRNNMAHIDTHPESFNQHLKQHPDTQWIAAKLYGVENIEVIRQGLRNGTVAGISDGSYHKKWHLGSAAWAIVDEPTGKALCGGGIVPGRDTDQNSYRSEAAGLLGLLLVVSTLLDRTPKFKPLHPIRMACDGESALLRSLSTFRDSFSCNKKCFDLISRIMDIRDSLTIEIVPTHVSGHQDDITMDLTFLEEWNVAMDALANQIIFEANEANFRPPDRLPPNKLGFTQVQCQQQPIHSTLDRSLRTCVAGKDTVEWWIKKERLTTQAAQKIDWKLCETVMKESYLSKKKFITKWITGQLPTGATLVDRRLRKSAQCPRCEEECEDTRHILECAHDGNRQIWNTAMRSLDAWLRKINTDPNIVRAFMLSIARWYSLFIDESYCPSLVSTEVKEAMHDQGIINWDNFITGLWSQKWSQIQDSYYKKLKKRNTGHRWAVKVSKRMWDILKGQWDHRNSILYRPDNRAQLEGREELLSACQLELDMGLQDIDEVYSVYFDTDIDTIEETKIYDIKLWFATIRRAREESGYVYREEDKVSDALRKWVGLRMDRVHRQKP